MLEAMIENAQGMPIIAPLRGEAAKVVGELLPDLHPSSFILHPSLSYLEFGWLTAHAHGIITDSGNVAEEATFNGVPCITLNSYTEHIETVKVGTNELVGEDAQLLGEMVGRMVHGEWKQGALPDRWDGRTAERIVQILMELQ
jgi:UDP-N-acetylglucosamine 2-epimerase (non-hydrolysing)